MEVKNYLKFPSVIYEKLCKGEISFPPDTRFDYEPIQSFRGITREINDFSAVTKKDFLSYAEMNVHRRGIDVNDPHYYGVSLFLNKESVENVLKFPRKNRKIAVGNVYPQAGPSEITEETGHICWWLYDNVEIEGFTIC